MDSGAQPQVFDGAGEPAEGRTAGRSVPPVPPRTPHEDAVLRIWREVLGRWDIGVTDDFFDLDGDSLHAIQVIGRIRDTWGVSIRAISFFETPTVEALAAAVAAGAPAQRPPVVPRPPDAVPLPSFEQQRLWLEDKLVPGSAYNVHNRRRLVGPLDVAALEASIRAILVRHESLRTRFPTEDGRPVQVVEELDEHWRLPVVDLIGGDLEQAARLADEDAATPFDLARGPLFRCLLVRVRDTEHVLSITAHHIVCDAWSNSLFARELAALYRVGGVVERAHLPALPVQYRDFAVWQHQWLTGEDVERQVDYWRRHLAGAPAALAMPTEWRCSTQRRSPGDAATAGRVLAALTAEETAAVHALGRAHDVTPFMILLAALASVLGRWSGQRDVVVGVPITGRTDVGTENLIGLFVNTLPLRVDLSGDPAFADLLARVRGAALGGYAHADAPLDLLVNELAITRVPGRTPLFQVALNSVDFGELPPFAGLATEPMPTRAAPSKFDLALTATEDGGLLRMELQFDAVRFDEAMVTILFDHLLALLRAVVADPTRDVLDYPLAAPADGTPFPADGCAPPTPRPASGPAADRIAVVDRNGSWTRRQLDRAADQVAQDLLDEAPGTAPDPLVGIVRRPTAGFVAAVLGCMRAGRPFAVIDPGASAPTVLDPDGPHGPVGQPAEQDAAPAAGPDASPEGTVDRLGLAAGDRVAVLSDRRGQLRWAVTAALDAGAALLVAEHSVADDPGAVVAWLRDNAVDVVVANPPVVRALAAHAPPTRLPALRCAVLDNAGDLLAHDVQAVHRMAEGCRVVGVYRAGRHGLPHAVVEVPDGRSPHALSLPLRIPLGRDLAHRPAWLRHPSGQAAATGEVAELCFGGHRTGDVGRRWSDGTLEYVGRVAATADPAETVGALRDAPGVRDAAVLSRPGPDGRSVLHSYVAGRDLDTAAIHRHLVARLPDHLVPDHLVVLDRLPLTPDGEYDRDRLPLPELDDTLGSYAAPRTPVERRLTEILHELLAVDRIDVHDSYFELGLSSLLATRLTSRILETFHVEVTLLDLFESAAVDRLADLIVQKQAALSGAEELEALLDEIGR